MWKNTSSYSKSDDKTQVRTTQLKLDGLVITVTKHIHYGEELIMSCDNVGISQRPLGTENMKEGQEKALELVENRLRKMCYAIEQVRIVE